MALFEIDTFYEFLAKNLHVIQVKVPYERSFVNLLLRVIDSHPDDDEQKRLTVVCMPGSQTQETDFQFISHLVDKGVRVIVPDLVGEWRC